MLTGLSCYEQTPKSQTLILVIQGSSHSLGLHICARRSCQSFFFIIPQSVECIRLRDLYFMYLPLSIQLTKWNATINVQFPLNFFPLTFSYNTFNFQHCLHYLMQKKKESSLICPYQSTDVLIF